MLGPKLTTGPILQQPVHVGLYMKMPVKLFLLVEGVGFKFEKWPIQAKTATMAESGRKSPFEG